MPIPAFVQLAQERLASSGSPIPKLMPQVFADAHDESGTQEDRRRRATEVATPAATIPALGGVIPPAGAPVTTTPPAPTVIDRLHKESCNQYGGYVYVGGDHDPSETDQIPPNNPGYLYKAKASSLNDAYQKALVMVTLLKDPDARVLIKVLGGKWIEDLQITSDRIDIAGAPRFTYCGQLVVQPTATKFTLQNAEVIQPPKGFGILVTPASPQPDTSGYVEFIDLKLHGLGNVFLSQRTVHLLRCHAWLDALPAGEVSAVLITAGMNDIAFSIADYCRFDGYAYYQMDDQMQPPGKLSYGGFAVMASGKVLGGWMPPFPIVTAPGSPYWLPISSSSDVYFRVNSGFIMRWCEINGMAVCEGWTLMHDHCKCAVAQGSGGPYVATGDTYCTIRGKEFGVSGGNPQGMQALVFWDQCIVRAPMIATFDSDSSDTLPYTVSGMAWFRSSEHLAIASGGLTEAGPGSFAFNQTATAGGWSVYTDGQSSTPRSAWPSTDAVGCGRSITDMFDPFQL